VHYEGVNLVTVRIVYLLYICSLYVWYRQDGKGATL